jgi:hypothetical protein
MLWVLESLELEAAGNVISSLITLAMTELSHSFKMLA